jgi:hypothetical protein
MHHQHGDRAAGDAGANGVRAAREDDRHARAEHEAGTVGIGQEGELLGEDVARLEIGHEQNVGSPGTADRIPLIAAASALIALSNASGPSRTPPVICPRSAILHNAAASSVAGIRELIVSTAARIATFGAGTSSDRARSMAFRQMSALSSRPGAMLIAASVTMSTL